MLPLPAGVKFTTQIHETLITKGSCEQIAITPEWAGEEKTSELTFVDDEYVPEKWYSCREGIQRGQRFLRVELSPLRYRAITHQYQHLRYAQIVIRLAPESSSPLVEHHGQIRWNEWTPPTEAIKLSNVDKGIYQVSGAQLRNAGVELEDIDPHRLQTWYRGKQIPCSVIQGQDNRFSDQDRVRYVADRRSGDQSYYHAVNDTNVVWLTWNNEETTRFKLQSTSFDTASVILSSPYSLHLEKDHLYYAGDNDADIQNTHVVPGEGWIWQIFNLGSSYRIPFSLPSLSDSADSVQICLRLRGTTLAPSDPDHHARFFINDQLVKDVYFSDREEKELCLKLSRTVLGPTESSVLRIESIDDVGATRSQFYLDWIQFSYLRQHRAANGWVSVETDTGGCVFVNGFSDSSVVVWDLERNTAITPGYSGYGHFRNIRVLSAGYMDGNFTQMFIDDSLVCLGTRGYNVLVIDPLTGMIQSSRQFDTWSAKQNVDSLVTFLNTLPSGQIVCAGIRDEGSQNMNEEAFRAWERLGSSLIRKVGTRDSWAIIGKVGAEPGSVPESLTRTGNGFAECNQRLFFPRGGNTFSVGWMTDSDSSIVFESSGIRTPCRLQHVTYSALRNQAIGADYIIITHKRFQDAANRLALYRETQNGFRCKIVTIDQIYDEFNYGLTEPSAIRDFLRYAYKNWLPPAPRYVLFLGDASWDPKRNIGNAVDWVPSFGHPVSDTWYACLDDSVDLLPDLSVGRLPVQHPEEANQMIDKIIQYESSPSGSWKKRFLFITGGFNDFEQGQFIHQSNLIIENYIDKDPVYGQSFMINKTTDNKKEGENRQEILDRLNEGVLWTNFIGHAGSRTWDLMFHSPDIEDLDNGSQLPFVSSMTCHTGRFAEPNQDSFGEKFVKQPLSGAISFLGTSGWGYASEDFLFLDSLFPIVLQDSIRYIGDAITKAKIALWEMYGSSTHVKNMIYQYALLGDPALKIALPEKPDLVLPENGIRLTPEMPSDRDSTAVLTLKLDNWGLTTRDSVRLRTSFYSTDDQSMHVESEYVLPPVGKEQSISIPIPSIDNAGPMTFSAEIDPIDLIDEVSEQNNSITYMFTVLSTEFEPYVPYSNAVLPANAIHFKLFNSQKQLLQDSALEFQIDTTLSFDSPSFKISGPINKGRYVTGWTPEFRLEPDIYYWRFRHLGQDDPSAWQTGSFRVADTFGWSQSQTEQFSSSRFFSTSTSKNGLALARQEIDMYVESAGYHDGNFARILIRDTAMIQPQRGHNVVIYNPVQDSVLTVETFDTYRDSTEANKLAQLIGQVKDGYLILLAIKDDGSAQMTESAFRALEGLGSQFCRQVKGRDSWAMISHKGRPDRVKEKWVQAGEGASVVVDTMSIYSRSGQVISERIGPAQSWNVSRIQAEEPEQTNLNLKIVGITAEGNTDTLYSISPLVSDFDISWINAQDYPFLYLVGSFETQNRSKSPVITDWSVMYDLPPEIAFGYDTFSQSADTVLVGETVNLELEIVNIGYSVLDSLVVQLDEINPQQEEQQHTRIPVNHTLHPDSSVTLDYTWSSTGKQGLYTIKLTADPENMVVEYNEGNNRFQTHVFVLSDTAKPEIEITFDGQTIVNGDYVSEKPYIEAKLYDNSPVSFQDTSHVTVMLDGIRMSYNRNEVRLEPASAEALARIELTPQLESGYHTLEVLFSDESRNQSYSRIDFQVSTELELSNPLNVPNPFAEDTEFTFNLTQPADVVLRVFTLAGRRIRELHPGYLTAGFQSIPWDGRDQDGDRLANGTYLYKIIATRNGKRSEILGKVIKMR
jgi:hypothetical protein